MNFCGEILQRTNFGVLIKLKQGKYWLPKYEVKETDAGISVPKWLARAKGMIK